MGNGFVVLAVQRGLPKSGNGSIQMIHTHLALSHRHFHGLRHHLRGKKTLFGFLAETAWFGFRLPKK